MKSTIAVSWKLKKELIKLKKHGKESYEEVIWRLLRR